LRIGPKPPDSRERLVLRARSPHLDGISRATVYPG
jgi:hypothetical protein